MKDASGTEGARAVWDKYKYAIAVIAIGAGLMLWPAGQRTAVAEAAPSPDLQAELQTVLGKINGVGEVWVLLTPESDGKRILASDRKVSFRGDSDYSESAETVLTQNAPFVTRTEYPTYRGALIVCEGADSPSVRLSVTTAVTALTGLPANRVAVVKCQ